MKNAAARLVSGSKKQDHITPILHQLHWLPVEKRITYKTLLITFMCLNNLAPSYLSDLVIQYKPTRTLRSSSKNLLVIPRTNTIRYGERAFCAVAPRLWNGLPLAIRSINSLERFKKKKSKHFFVLYSDNYDW